MARDAFSGRGFFVSARRLQADGSWIGPGEGACALVEEDALSALGGLKAAHKAGANTVLCRLTGDLAGAMELGMRCLVREPFAADEPTQERAVRLARLGESCRRFSGLDGVVPTSTGEAQGLDTLQFFAACRLALPPTTHLIVDLDMLGHKLGQLCLSFGADEILGSITGQRALRLGARVSSHDITRDEAALLLRAAGFSPCERLPDGQVQPR
jgi:hypothetical protein